MSGGNKRGHTLKQTCSFQLQICFSMCDLFVIIRHERIKIDEGYMPRTFAVFQQTASNNLPGKFPYFSFLDFWKKRIFAKRSG